MQGPVKDNMII